MKRIICTKIDEEDYKEFMAIVKKERRTTSDLLRLILHDYLYQRQAKLKRSKE